MQYAVIQQEEIPVERFALRVPKLRRIGRAWPVIKLVLIAVKATVEQVFQAVIAIFVLRLKMVNSQQSARIHFGNAAICAGEIRPRAHLFAKFGINGLSWLGVLQ
ncbi:MAG TPA: hypothetical protein VGB07_15780 [Blastocatellia bacterium]